MAKPKQAPTLDPETLVQEQPIESPVEAEVVEQRGEETPDPLAEITLEQLRQHPRLGEDLSNLTREEAAKAYREGQSAAGKQLDADKKKWAVEQQALATFDHWERKRKSDDPYENQEFAQAIGNPEVRQAYDQGQTIRRGPSSQEVGERAIHGAMDSVYQPLKKHPLLKDMTEEEHQALVMSPDKNDPQPFTTLVNKYCELVIERGIAAGRTKALQDAREEGRREAYDEAGLEYPGEPVEGRKAPKPGSAQDLRKQYADGDIDTATYNKKMIAIGASP